MREIVAITVAIIILLLIIFVASPALKIIGVKHDYMLNEIEEGSYKTRKDVEDTCRSMIAAYKADVSIYEMYKDSENPNQRNYADAALVRAIQAANTYNEYILKNSFIWEGNIPTDIVTELPTEIK